MRGGLRGTRGGQKENSRETVDLRPFTMVVFLAVSVQPKRFQFPVG